jgi:NAD(P)-dependent dehydrogenase (short-subunit alcohol dehydrogenase family)
VLGSTSVEGKTAIITGTTSGLGRSLACVWAAQGANVVATGRREKLGQELEQQMCDHGYRATFVPADVSRSADCDEVIREAVERYGGVDVLVNNAVSRARSPTSTTLTTPTGMPCSTSMSAAPSGWPGASSH